MVICLTLLQLQLLAITYKLRVSLNIDKIWIGINDITVSLITVTTTQKCCVYDLNLELSNCRDKFYRLQPEQQLFNHNRHEKSKGASQKQETKSTNFLEHSKAITKHNFRCVHLCCFCKSNFVAESNYVAEPKYRCVTDLPSLTL